MGPSTSWAGVGREVRRRAGERFLEFVTEGCAQRLMRWHLELAPLVQHGKLLASSLKGMLQYFLAPGNGSETSGKMGL